MVKKLSQKFVKGVGSVIDIYPAKNYPVKSYIPTRNAADRLRGDWIKVGRTLSKTVTSQTNVQK